MNTDAPWSRRELLAILGGATASACGARTERARPEPTELTSSATSIARAIAREQVSSLQIVQAHLDRIAKVNPVLNAVVQVTAEAALDAAQKADVALKSGEALGPLHGVPMTIKDSLDTAGVITTAGTKGRSGYVPAEDATVVRRLREAGAILIGKTNTPELTFAGQTDNLVYGRTNNPYDIDRSPGGSSGGAAAIVAAAGSPFDVGSDTGGSVRAPAHCTGICGIKPTSGRVPRTGHIVGFDDVLESLTTLGPLARTVDDLALVLSIIHGPDGRDPAIAPVPLGDPTDVETSRLRVAYYTDNDHVAADTATANAVREAASVLRDEGCVVEEKRPGPIPESDSVMFALFADGGESIRRRLDHLGTTEPHPWLSVFLDPESGVSASEAYRRIERWASYRREMLAFLEHTDVILCPVLAYPAPHHLGPGEASDYSAWYTEPYNLTGWPATVVRCGTSPEGLPIGVQVVSGPWREDRSLAAAKVLEDALGGYRPPPDIG